MATPPVAPPIVVTPPARAPSTLSEFVAAPVPAGVSGTLVGLRDSALKARDRARRVGAIKNNVPSVVLAETMLQSAEQGLRGGTTRARQAHI